MKKILSLVLTVLFCNQLFAYVEFYNCVSTEGKLILKTGPSDELIVRVSDKQMAINNKGRIWSYLSLEASNEKYSYFTSETPENFLQSTDLKAQVDAGLFANALEGKILLTNTSKATEQYYNCTRKSGY